MIHDGMMSCKDLLSAVRPTPLSKGIHRLHRLNGAHHPEDCYEYPVSPDLQARPPSSFLTHTMLEVGSQTCPPALQRFAHYLLLC